MTSNTLRNRQIVTSDNELYYTPRVIVDAARDVFGGSIDLDPASDQDANQLIAAKRIYTIADDGLRQDWRASSIWLNPPFSINSGRKSSKTGKEVRTRVIDAWVSRWLTAIEERETVAAMLLVPARMDTEWFQGLYGYPMCFPIGRLRFYGPTNVKHDATFATVIVYAGNKTADFYARFEQIGNCGRFTR
jgi:hypothetical protein